MSSSEKDHIWEIDLDILDPKLEVRLRLPHLRKLSIPPTIAQLTATYVEQVTLPLFACLDLTAIDLPFVVLRISSVWLGHFLCHCALQLTKDYKYHDLVFDVSERSDVDDAMLQLIAKGGVRWREIDVQFCKGVSEKGLATLKESYPDAIIK